MATYTYDIFAKGIEQGGWSGSATTSRSDRVRDTDYTEITTKFVSPKVTATCNTGKTVEINFYGYNSSKSLLCDLYWYASPKTFDVSSYSGLKYFRIQLRYSDNSEITPSQITSLKVEVEVPDQWYIDDNGELNINNLAEEIPGDVFTSPYPLSLWNFISSTDSTLTLNNEGFNIMLHPIVDPEHNRNDTKNLTAPYPASVWYADEENKPTNELLPEELHLGAFCECTVLSEMKIPESVKSIGERAFYHTNLMEVTIARDCTFYPTSFPVGCQINYYEEE